MSLDRDVSDTRQASFPPQGDALAAGTPSALSHARSLASSRLRSPRSHLLTWLCVMPSRAASAVWLSPASFRTRTRRSRACAPQKCSPVGHRRTRSTRLPVVSASLQVVGLTTHPLAPLQSDTRDAGRPAPISRARSRPRPVEVGIPTSMLERPHAEGPAPRTQCTVRASTVVVSHPLAQDRTQMRLRHREHLGPVNTNAAHRRSTRS